MTDDHRRAREALDALDRARQRLAVDIHELIRRDDTMPTIRDGYPTRTPGAPATTAPTREASEEITVWQLPGFGWNWRCSSCGDDATSRTDGAPTRDHGYIDAAAALTMGQRHLTLAHDTRRTIDYSDPTGEAASSTPPADPVRAMRNATMRAIDSYTRGITALADRLHDFLTEHPPATSGDPGCQSCARLSTYVPTRVTSDIGGRLTEPRRLCRWCQDVVIATSKLPTLDDLRAHHEGRPVKRPA